MNTLTLMTATGAENLGDELITLCEIQRFRKEDPTVQIFLFSHDPQRTERFLKSQNISQYGLTILPYFPTAIKKNPIGNIRYLIKTLHSFWISNHIYIGGGGLLYGSSEEGHSPLKLWWMRAKLAKLLKKPITYLSLGVSVPESEIKKYAKGIFENTSITVRDKESQKKVLALGYTAQIHPDPVFEYTIQQKTGDSHKKNNTIGIALRSGFIPDETILVVIKMLLQKNYTVYLLPHSLHPDDINAHDGYYLQKFLLPGVKITQSIEQTLSAYPSCDVIIGMRLHSIILASVMKIPLLAISYSTKTKSILTEMQQSFLDAKETTAASIVSQIETLLNQ